MTGESLAVTGKLLGHRKHETAEIFEHLDDQYLASTAERVSAVLSSWLAE